MDNSLPGWPQATGTGSTHRAKVLIASCAQERTRTTSCPGHRGLFIATQKTQSGSESGLKLTKVSPANDPPPSGGLTPHEPALVSRLSGGPGSVRSASGLYAYALFKVTSIAPGPDGAGPSKKASLSQVHPHVKCPKGIGSQDDRRLFNGRPNHFPAASTFPNTL